MVTLSRGALSRAGKVKISMSGQNLEKTNTDHSYSNQGRCKYKSMLKNNRQYKSGAYKLHHQLSIQSEAQLSVSIANENMTIVNEKSPTLNNNESSPPTITPNSNNNIVILNSFHKYNSEKGHERIEYSREHSEHTQLKYKHRKYGPRTDCNHKKWNRNHPKGGIYQKREEFTKQDE